MSEELDPQQNPSPAPATQADPNAPTPASNQSLILGIILGALVLLLLLIVISQQLNRGGDDSELSKMKSEVASAQARIDVERARLGMPSGGQSVDALNQRIKSDTDALAGLVGGIQAELTNLRDSNKSIPALTREIDSLRQQLASAQGAQDQVAGLQARLKDAEDRLAALREQLAKAPDPSVLAQLERYRAELEELREKSAGMVDGARLASLQRLVDELQPQNDHLRREVQRLRAELDQTRLFVTKDQLSPRAVALFRELESLEGSTSQERELAYQRIRADLNAQVVDSIHFATGHADVDFQKETHLGETVKSANQQSFFLVVGYASKIGDADVNQTLSSQRATRVASVVNHIKAVDQQVQAVYFGATGRFGTENEPNQVCELWEIHP